MESGICKFFGGPRMMLSAFGTCLSYYSTEHRVLSTLKSEWMVTFQRYLPEVICAFLQQRYCVVDSMKESCSA